MKTFAVEQQQCLYELLPDYIMYKSDEHKYLKQNIGYACFGSPKNEKDANTQESNKCYYKTEDSNDTNVTNTDVTDKVGYGKKAEEIIDKIYDQICKCTVQIDNSQPIYLGIIYNMIFRPKTNVKPKKKEKKEEAKTEVKEEEKQLTVSPIPIFNIKKSIPKKSEKDAKEKEILYETWYIDSSARVYKTWTDYIKNNTLPQCTMVLPKDGAYQSDPNYPVAEDYSTVWLEIMESPACTWKAKICNGMDIASNVIGLGTVGLSVISLFTPLAPVVVGSGKLPFNM